MAARWWKLIAAIWSMRQVLEGEASAWLLFPLVGLLKAAACLSGTARHSSIAAKVVSRTRRHAVEGESACCSALLACSSIAGDCGRADAAQRMVVCS